MHLAKRDIRGDIEAYASFRAIMHLRIFDGNMVSLSLRIRTNKNPIVTAATINIKTIKDDILMRSRNVKIVDINHADGRVFPRSPHNGDGITIRGATVDIASTKRSMIPVFKKTGISCPRGIETCVGITGIA
jgi:hypothetical protein